MQWEFRVPGFTSRITVWYTYAGSWNATDMECHRHGMPQTWNATDMEFHDSFDYRDYCYHRVVDFHVVGLPSCGFPCCRGSK
jgi:hypothetical protein